MEKFASNNFKDVKALFEMAIKAERPVHLLLCGPPSSGKSLFMSSLTRLERSYYASMVEE
jgi:ABC-type polar amino acid transport system ATPase subunit